MNDRFRQSLFKSGNLGRSILWREGEMDWQPGQTAEFRPLASIKVLVNRNRTSSYDSVRKDRFRAS